MMPLPTPSLKPHRLPAFEKGWHGKPAKKRCTHGADFVKSEEVASSYLSEDTQTRTCTRATHTHIHRWQQEPPRVSIDDTRRS